MSELSQIELAIVGSGLLFSVSYKIMIGVFLCLMANNIDNNLRKLK
jgi:hypothetical protein